MAIEIIKRGKLPEAQRFRLDCKTCKTEFSCTRGDMSVSSDQRDPGLYIKCPVCSDEVWKVREGYTSVYWRA